MKRIFFILCVVSRASFEMQTVQRFYMSRKARSNTQPVKSGYVYTKINNEPPTIATFDNNVVNEPKKGAKHQRIEQNKDALQEKCEKCSQTNHLNGTTTTKAPETTKKANKSNTLTSAPSNMISSYTMNNMFHSDDEDIRTDSRNYYDSWPFLYHTPYDYSSFKFDYEVEKAKDKRFAASDMDKIIPVFEEHDDITETYIYTGPRYKHAQLYTTDNPIYGNKPFFSHVLNDYFDKTYDEDPFIYKGNWEKEFDNEISKDIDDYIRSRRLENKFPEQHLGKSYSQIPTESLVGYDTVQDAVRSKTYDQNKKFETSEKGNDNKHNYKGEYKHDGKNMKEFKKFADAFANRFGSEDHEKGSKFSIKNNANKGEKKKGFRKVYHKDEYQEHNDFFDDANNSVKTEEHGSSNVRIGGSEGYLGSNAEAALGHEENTMNKSEDVESNQFEKRHEDSKLHKGMDSDFNLYRNMAESAALSNNDYFDSYHT